MGKNRDGGGGLSRRDLLTGAGAGVVCAGLGSVMAGCNGLVQPKRAVGQRDDLSVRVVNDHINYMSRYRDQLLRDRHRATYHFVVPEGIAEPFDPNGAIYWKGRYHLFYIFQNEKGDCWGHVSSSDLIHWRWHPTALEPSKPDAAIYSGNAFVNKNGVPTIMYHGLDAGNSIAFSEDNELDNWKKAEFNPIVPNPKKGERDYGRYDSWDPHAWLEGDTYYAIFGGNPEWGSPATLFKSRDLRKWKFMGNFLDHEMPGVAEDEDISCPDFFKLGDKHMLLCISHNMGCRYYLGEFRNEKFYPEKHSRMNWPGGDCFAPESLLDDKGRRIMWAWALDPRTNWGTRDEKITEHGWSGTMTLPRVLSLDDDGVLHIEPVEELKALRTGHKQKKNLAVVGGTELKIDDIKGDCLELDLTINPKNAVKFGIKVRCSEGGEEETPIMYDSKKRCVRIDLAKTSLDKDLMEWYEEDEYKQEAPFELRRGEALNLRIFLDRSIMEVFVNRRQCLTQRLYATRDDSQSIVLFSKAGNIKVPLFNAWKMNPSNPW